MNQHDTRTRMLDERAWQDLQDEARIANEIQAENPDVTRTEALKVAKNFIERANKEITHK